jgi:hypothetical protein
MLAVGGMGSPADGDAGAASRKSEVLMPYASNDALTAWVRDHLPEHAGNLSSGLQQRKRYRNVGGTWGAA